MDRVLESPVKIAKPRRISRAEDHRILFPGEESWDLWLLRSGKALLHPDSLPLAKMVGLKISPELAIPLQLLSIFPLWLATTNQAQMREMVALQLESRGLEKSATGSSFDFQVVKQEQERSLLAVSVLAENFPSDLCLPRIINYRPATDYWTLPSNQVLFWRELNRLTFGVTSGPHLIYVQSSAGQGLHHSFLLEVHCALLLLENEGCIPPLQGITLWGSFPQPEIENLRQALELPVHQPERPTPIRPAASRNLRPPSVHHFDTRQKQSRQRRRWVLAAIALYLTLLLGLAGQIGSRLWQKSSLDQELASRREETNLLRNSAERWRAMEQAILPETYPIEMLYRCTRLLPDDGLRFLTYDQDATHLLITGEAKNALMALQYIESLKKDPELDAYIWEMPPPKLLPNDSAQFQIEGKRKNEIP